MRAYFNMAKLKKPDSFFSWLLGIADRVAKERQRKDQLRRQKEIVRSFSEEAPGAELSQDFALETAIAERLSMPLGTVTKTLSRAYAMLRKSLNQQAQTELREVEK